MKKISAIILAMCLLVSALCITAIAAEPASDLPPRASNVVLRVTALKKDTKIAFIGDYTVFEDGWNDAMELANSSSEMKLNGYDRVVVDIYADWTADDGEFTDDIFNGPGFDWDAIYIQDGVKITLNMNGHTIDRGLTAPENNGEVICVDEGADFIINNGTIKGGFSFNGAGGIHIKENATVTLNNVTIESNKTNGKHGAGITVLRGATLIMNGGSFLKNELNATNAIVNGAAIYVTEGAASFTNVEFKNQCTTGSNTSGVAIYATGSEITIDQCKFTGNGLSDPFGNYKLARSVICGVGSTVTIKSSSFSSNGGTNLIQMNDGELFMESSSISGNKSTRLFSFDNSDADIMGTNITGNTSKTLYINNGNEVVTLIGCTVGNNSTDGADVEVLHNNTLVITDCTLQDTSFSNEDYVKVTYSEVTQSDALIRITKVFRNGTTETAYHRFFEYGWNLAIEAALTNQYDRVIVDLYGDWNAVDGQFTNNFFNGAGFNWDAIYVPANVRVTLNMNGHTINRGLTTNEANGEVIYVDKNADFIINDGTITGGFSHNGAGGIHINGNAIVTLNNVHVTGNWVEDEDGSAIAAHDGATLIMNGGSISNNTAYRSQFSYVICYGSLYLKNSAAMLTDVEITNNGGTGTFTPQGVAIYMVDSNVTMTNCTVSGNGLAGGATDYGKNHYRVAASIVAVKGASVLNVNNSKFENNGAGDSSSGSAIFHISDGTVKINDSTFTNNSGSGIFTCDGGVLEVTDCKVTNNNSRVFNGAATRGSYFTNCEFNANTVVKGYTVFYFEEDNNLTFNTCDFGDSTFNDVYKAKFDKLPDGSLTSGSIFGEGSLNTILSLAALVISVACMGVTLSLKKQLVPAKAADDE